MPGHGSALMIADLPAPHRRARHESEVPRSRWLLRLPHAWRLKYWRTVFEGARSWHRGAIRRGSASSTGGASALRPCRSEAIEGARRSACWARRPIMAYVQPSSLPGEVADRHGFCDVVDAFSRQYGLPPPDAILPFAVLQARDAPVIR